MTTRRGWSPEIVGMVTSLFLDKFTAPEILRKLEVDLARGVISVEKLPELRTIERWLKPLRSVDRSGRWRLGPAADDKAGFVLAARAEVMTETEGRVSEISNETVSWLLSVHEVAPDLDPVSAHRVARLYQIRTEQGGETGDLDAWLGFGPWRSDAAAARYEAAVVAGWITPPASALNFNARVIIAASTAATGGRWSGQGSDLRWVDPLAEVDDAPGPP